MAKERIRSACPYCGVGCGVVLDVEDGRIVALSGDRDHPANRGRLCTKGKTAHEALAAPGRLATGLRRASRQGPLESVPAGAAIAECGRRLREIVDAHGPDAVALYVSGQMSIEAQYLASKLAKGFLRTRHIESNSRLCMASAGVGYKLSLGADAPPGSYDDFDRTDLFLVMGANMADCHPILFLRMMDRVKEGAKLIVVDPRRTATADKADLHLAPRPGGDLALLNGLLHLVAEAGGLDRAFIERFTEGWEAMPSFLADYTPAKVAEMTGLAEADIRRAAAAILAAGSFVTLWTMGLNQSVQGTFNTNAICNLHLATGQIGRPGSGPFSLTGQPNAMGGREMGYMGPGLPGQRSALVEADRAFCEARWNLAPGTIRAEAGLGTIGMFEAMRAGEIRAVWIVCTNPVASVAGRGMVAEALARADLVIAQDIFAETETNAFADILLPAAASFEADGVMVNSERSMVLTPAAARPPGEALPDWRIIADIACAMGYAQGFSYRDAAEVFDEIRGFGNPQTGYEIAGVSHARLRAEGPMQWPAPRGAGPRNPVRYRTPDGGYRFATASGKARFWPRPHAGPAERPDGDFPLVLNTGRVQHQWHTMTKTGKVGMLARLNPGPFVEIHPRDAARVGVLAGDRVELSSRRGRAVLPAVVSDRVLEGCLFAPFHWNDLFGADLAVNAVTGTATDPLSLQPEFKVSAVSLRKLAAAQPEPAEETPMNERSFAPLKPELASIASALGLGSAVPLELDGPARQWLAGFLLGLSARTDAAPPAPALPREAPLPGAARILVEGMLAGLYSRRGEPASPAGAAREAAGRKALTVLFASQTGNAEAAAEAFARHAESEGWEAAARPLDAVDPAGLSGAAVIFASTFGDGDPPDNAAGFWTALSAVDAPRLEGLRYAVIAFGDSSYTRFCGFGERLDARLAGLGARRLGPRTDCDAGEEEKAAKAGQAALAALAEPAAARPKRGPARDAPAPARLVLNRLLSAEGCGKEVRQFGLWAEEGVAYEAGDALGVLPENCPDLVAEILAALGAKEDAPVTVRGEGEMPAREALSRHLEIARPSQEFLTWWAELAGDPALAALLGGDRAALDAWLWGRQTADILAAFPARAGAAEFCGRMRRLQPRLYSIASSPKVSPDRIDLTVSVVRHALHGRPRKGVASAYLADRAGEGPVRLFVQAQAHFRPPADAAAPAIMIGPGTGVAPFRAFLQEREALGATGRNWLFFGEQNRDTGFYYREEMEAWLKSGHLARLDTAFSRDQADKVYVQHRMREQGAELWKWLEEGAHVYVCGDASRMAKDVDATLAAIAVEHGGLDAEAARALLQQLAGERRYARDVY